MKKEGKKVLKSLLRVRINKKRLGMIGTKRCKRCKEFFYPSHGSQVLCPYCQNRPYGGRGRPNKYEKCLIFGCKRKHWAKNYCEIHYKQLIGSPKEIRAKKLKVAEKWVSKGTRLCEMFKECEVYFIPKARNQYGLQKICPTCARKRSYVTKRDKTGRPRI